MFCVSFCDVVGIDVVMTRVWRALCEKASCSHAGVWIWDQFKLRQAMLFVREFALFGAWLEGGGEFAAAFASFELDGIFLPGFGIHSEVSVKAIFAGIPLFLLCGLLAFLELCCGLLVPFEPFFVGLVETVVER